MPTPWCEFWAVEMLIFMVVCAAAPAAKPKASVAPRTSCESFTVSLQIKIEGPQHSARTSKKSSYNFLRGNEKPARASHVRVVRPATALGGDPDDVLRRVLDVAGLAMHAVGRVDLQAVVVVLVFHEFVYAGRAIAAFGARVLGEIHLHGNRIILQREVGGLLFGMVCIRNEHRRE